MGDLSFCRGVALLLTLTACPGPEPAGPDGPAVPDGGPTVCTPGSTWTTIDDFQPGAGLNSIVYDLAIDPQGTIYALGARAGAGGRQHAFVRKSGDGGATWTSVDDYQMTSGRDTNVSGIAAPSTGVVVYGGDSTDANGTSPLYVRRSGDGGGSWTTTPFQYKAGQSMQGGGVTADAAGNVYQVGGGIDGNNIRWLVRRSKDNGLSFTTIDDFLYPGLMKTQSVASGLLAVDAQRLYVVGHSVDSAFGFHWMVRTSSDGGATWGIDEDAPLSPGLNHLNASVLAANARGDLFALGRVEDVTMTSHAVVRRKLANASVWSTVDDFQLRPGQPSISSGLVEDEAGRLYLLTYGQIDQNTTRWLTRRSADGGTTWTTVDEFGYMGGAVGLRLVRDRKGNLYAAGAGKDAQGSFHALVRRLTCSN